MAFKPGNSVEISSDEEGFLGSYYTAKILKPTANNRYLVEYDALLTDDESRLLRETIDATQIRPSPPVIRAYEFRLLDEVDAFDNDGWWVGRVVDRDLRDGTYRVFFDSSGTSVSYTVDRLRVHQDWDLGKWCISNYHKCQRL